MNTTLYSIIGLDSNGKVVSSYGKLYKDKRELALFLADLQIKEYDKLKDSIDAESYVDDAKEERDEADKALEQFFFDSKFGMKLCGVNYEPKYHIPLTFQIMELSLDESILKEGEEP